MGRWLNDVVDAVRRKLREIKETLETPILPDRNLVPIPLRPDPRRPRPRR